jgi:RNA polymerase sigma-70 factor (ECF subfamily)
LDLQKKNYKKRTAFLKIVKEMTKDFKNVLDDWVNNYAAALLSRAIYKISDIESAKDIVQETFLDASKNIHSFKHKSKAKTWLFSILNNKISTRYQSGYRYLYVFYEKRRMD